jgi:membrane-bound serine protease (ClpP class)
MSDIEALLAILVHPTVALLLLTIGINAILIELSQPGGYVAGILGAISLLVAFYSLGVLDANLLGLAFMGLAFLLFAADIVAPTHGALTLGGVISFAVGAFILLNSPYYPFPWAALGGLTLGTGLIVAFAARATWRARRSRVTTGREGLVGLVGTARSDLDPTGRVMVYGELWRAVSDSGKIARGSRVRVLAVEGMQLRVEPAATTDSQT